MPAATVTRAATAVQPRTDRSRAPQSVPAAHTPFSVLTCLHSFAPGGVERIAARLHASWRAQGVESRLLLADTTVTPPQPLDRIAQARRKPHGRGPTGFVALVAGARALVAADRPHVLFCAGNTYSAVAVALRLLLGRDCPPVVAKISNCLVRPDMPWPVRFCYRRWLRIQGRYIDHFVGMAPAMRGEIARFTGVPQSRISIIEDPAVSTACLGRLATARDAARGDAARRPGRHYIAIGRLAPQKNFALLLDAFARIAAADDTLTILGDGPERAALERRGAELGITAALRLPGHVEPLDPWLATADALVMSSDYEGVPAVIVEALATGLPIVATDCCVSMGDLLGHGALGRLVPVGDSAALADAMAAIDTAPEPAATLAARRAAAQRFTIDHAGDKYLGLMRGLAAAREAERAAIDTARSNPVPSRAA